MRRKRERTRQRKAPAKKVVTRSPQTKRTPAKKKKTNKVLNRIKNGVLIGIFVIILTVLGVGVGMYISIEKEIQDMNVQDLAINYSSLVYYTDENGNSHELEKLYDNGDRIWIDGDKISPLLKDAIVSIEDERFYSHNGIDIKRTGGAFLGWVMDKLGLGESSYGGSTITQQAIKNITKEKTRSATRKIKEMMRAIALEKELSKDEILTVYLNLIFLANDCYGVEAASNLYFDKKAIDLTLPEAALIAGITQRPSYYDPIRNPENALTKRNTVLAKMYELGKITEQEYNDASSSDLNLHPNYKERKSKVYSYFVDNLINEVLNDLQTEKGYSDTFAHQLVFSGGLKIYSTMDPSIQNAVESVFENNSNFPSIRGEAQSAMVIMDPYTGELKGLVGGKGVKTEARGYNRATQMLRQPGSSIKPLTVYGPSIDTGVISAASVVNDSKLTIGKWSPKNSYSGYRGYMPLRRALEISANTPAVRTLQDLGVATAFEYAEDVFHLSTLEPSDKDLSPMGLGGLTRGVSPKEMAAAYSVFANGGMYNAPHSYTKVVDHSGKVLLEYNDKPKRVLKDSTAYIINNLLTSVVTGSSGTARGARLSSMQVCGKTGTTNNDHDKWFIGYTPYYVGAVWYGFDTPASIRQAGVSTNPSVNLWKAVMEKVHDGLAKQEFTPPDSVSRVVICTSTGKRASSGCAYARSEYFANGTAPKGYCHNAVGLYGQSEDPNATTDPSASPNPEDVTQIEGDNPGTEDPTQDTPGDHPDVTLSPEPQEPTPTPEPTQGSPSTEPTVIPDDDVITLE